MNSARRAVLTSALMGLCGFIAAAVVLPRTGAATPPPARYHFVFIERTQFWPTAKVDSALSGCNAVAMTTIHGVNDNREYATILCRP